MGKIKTMQRIFLNSKNLWENILKIDDKEIIHQFLKVLRFSIWEKTIFFDGNNFFDYVYEISWISKKDIILNFIEKKEKQLDTNISLNLYQSIPNKIQKLEYIIQKSTEVWFKSFNFFYSDRSQNLILTDNKKDRLKKICIESVEQSWWNFIPEINFIEKIDFDNIWWENLFFHLDKNNSIKIKDYQFKGENINLFVWPEWWRTQKEISFFKERDFNAIFLWDRIFRTETVSSVAWFFILSK